MWRRPLSAVRRSKAPHDNQAKTAFLLRRRQINHRRMGISGLSGTCCTILLLRIHSRSFRVRSLGNCRATASLRFPTLNRRDQRAIPSRRHCGGSCWNSRLPARARLHHGDRLPRNCSGSALRDPPRKLVSRITESGSNVSSNRGGHRMRQHRFCSRLRRGIYAKRNRNHEHAQQECAHKTLPPFSATVAQSRGPVNAFRSAVKSTTLSARAESLDQQLCHPERRRSFAQRTIFQSRDLPLIPFAASLCAVCG